MDLCSRDYGFFHTPGLSVFLNPWSRFPMVTDELVHGRGATIDDFRSEHGDEATRDLLCRGSPIWHETKHFPDVLFTPFRPHLLRLAFKAVFAALLLLSDRSWRRTKTLLPLLPNDVESPELIDRVKKYVKDFQEAQNSARRILEASATLAQLQFLWTHHGGEYKSMVEQHIGEAPEYSEFLDRL